MGSTQMRRTIRLFFLISLLSLNSCAAWFKELRDNPVLALNSGLSYISTALSIARGAFEIWAVADPGNANLLRSQFTQITNDVDRGLLVAQDGLRIASHLGGPTPNANILLQDAQHSMGTLNNFLSGLPGNGTSSAINPSMREALDATRKASQPLDF